MVGAANTFSTATLKFLLCLAYGFSLQSTCSGGAYVQLRSFGNPQLTGGNPSGDLIEASDAQLYGVSKSGGTNATGVLFRLNKATTNYVALYSFGGADGENANGSLLETPEGFLYGLCYSGGNSGLGTLFKVNKDGTDYRVLRHFSGTESDGGNPRAGVMLATDQILYGTTSTGGSSNRGTVFRINKDGTGFGILHNFGNGTNDGANPYAPLIEGADGLLYGTTSDGGSNNLGTIFKLAKNGSGYFVIKHFRQSGGDGSHPHGRLLQVPDGRLFGTTAGGFVGDTFGGVFRINTDGTGFSSVGSLSFASEAGLMQAQDGLLYGNAAGGGATGNGRLFRLATNGTTITTIRSFSGLPGDGGGANQPTAHLE